MFDEEQEDNRNEEKINDYAGGMRAQVIEGPGLYYMGIIDTLQTYNLKKIIVTDNEYYSELKMDRDDFSQQSMLVYPGKDTVNESISNAMKQKKGLGYVD